jgi:hypothetical protein
MLKYRMTGAMKEAFAFEPNAHIEQISQLTPGRFVSAPGLWVGLAFCALCLALSIRLRRNREPI